MYLTWFRPCLLFAVAGGLLLCSLLVGRFVGGACVRAECVRSLRLVHSFAHLLVWVLHSVPFRTAANERTNTKTAAVGLVGLRQKQPARP